MPATLKRKASADIGVNLTMIGAVQASPLVGYVIPEGATAAIKGITIVSRNGQAANASVALYNQGAFVSFFIERADIPPGDGLVVVGSEKTDFLQAGDYIIVQCHAGMVDALWSFAEITP
jgi:hypothetical protein